MSDPKQEDLERAGCGPVFEVADLPEPPRDLNAKKLFAIMGPAVIALGGTIGGGEWLVGPSLFVKWGLGLLWITTVSSLLQVFLNLEMCRYTLYTGEPITVGFMRLKPGKAFWGWLFTIVGFMERGLPGWALGTATAIAAVQLGKIPALATAEPSRCGESLSSSPALSSLRWGGRSSERSNGRTGR